MESAEVEDSEQLRLYRAKAHEQRGKEVVESVEAEGCGTARTYWPKAHKQRGHDGRRIRPKPKAALQLGPYRPRAATQRGQEGRPA